MSKSACPECIKKKRNKMQKIVALYFVVDIMHSTNIGAWHTVHPSIRRSWVRILPECNQLIKKLYGAFGKKLIQNRYMYPVRIFPGM
jgi:hypothetical protein